jgi:hypothetical protein
VQLFTGRDQGNGHAIAYFYVPVPTPDEQKTTRQGDCTRTITYPIQDNYRLLDVGPITVTSQPGTKTFNSQGSSGLSLYQPSAPPLWGVGDTATVISAGGDLPGFTATVTFPAAADLTLPADRTAISRASDIVVSFTADGTEAVELWLQEQIKEGATGKSPYVKVDCFSEPGRSAITIPKELLAAFTVEGTGTSDPPLTLGGGRTHVQLARAGQYAVPVYATYAAVSVHLSLSP